MKHAFIVMLACTLAGCASPQTRDIAGYGGIGKKTDSFTGSTVVESGKGMIFCPEVDGFFCSTGFSLSYRWTSTIPGQIIVTATQQGYENLRELAWSIDGDFMVFQPIDPLTEFSTPGAFAQLPESYQRYAMNFSQVRSLLSGSKVMVRLGYVNNRVSRSGDFMRAGGPGQVMARELLAAFIEQVDGTSAP